MLRLPNIKPEKRETFEIQDVLANLKETIFNDKRSIFSELKDKSNFKDFKVEHSTVVWSTELDLASEFLFYVAFKEDPDLQDRFKQWSYLAS